MFLLGYGVTLDLKHIPVCTFDREASQDSQALLKRFEASSYFRISRNLPSYPALVAAIDRGDCKLAIVIPPDFSQRLNDTNRATVQAILDATDDNTANIAFGYASAVVAGYSSDMVLDALDRQGQQFQLIQPMTVQSRVWFNEDLESRNFIITGLVAVIMALVGAQLTSLTISREWERGTMELLVSTPVTPGEVMVGKLAPYLALGWVDASFCLVIATFWFGVPFRGTLFTLFVTTTLFLIVVLGIGYLLSVLIRSQIGASQVALLLTMLPTTLLVRLCVSDRSDADAYPGHHVSGLLPILRNDHQGDISQGRGHPGAGHADRLSAGLRRGGHDIGRTGVPQELGLRRSMLNRVSHILVKEFIQLWRDKWGRFRLIVPPVIQFLLFGYAATFEVYHVSTAVLDLDHTQESRELIARFTSSNRLNIVQVGDNPG